MIFDFISRTTPTSGQEINYVAPLSRRSTSVSKTVASLKSCPGGARRRESAPLFLVNENPAARTAGFS